MLLIDPPALTISTDDLNYLVACMDKVNYIAVTSYLIVLGKYNWRVKLGPFAGRPNPCFLSGMYVLIMAERVIQTVRHEVEP